MVKKQSLVAIAVYLTIPVAAMAGAGLSSLIDPDVAAGHPNYERNYWLLSQLKSLCLLGALAVDAALWILTCLLLVRSKRRSRGWLALSLLGPFGLIGLSMLRDLDPDADDAHEEFTRRMRTWWRAVYEACKFVIAWLAAFAAMQVISYLVILRESAVSGLSVAKIVEIRDASSGMYAFSEGLVVLYLVPLLYLVWPIGWNVAASFLKRRGR